MAIKTGALGVQRVGSDAGKDGERQSTLPGLGHALAQVVNMGTHSVS